MCDCHHLFTISIEAYNGKIPFIVSDIINELKKRHSEKVEGIFRLNGSDSRIKELISELNRGPISSWDNIKDVHTLSTTLKRYFREMTESRPIIPFEIYELLMKTNEDNDTKMYSKVKSVIHGGSVPKQNMLILAFIFEYLYSLSLFQEENQMSPKNLSICFTPNLLVPKEPSINMMSESLIANRVIELMIANYKDLFGNVIITDTDFCTEDDIAFLLLKPLDMRYLYILINRFKIRQSSIIPLIPNCRKSKKYRYMPPNYDPSKSIGDSTKEKSIQRRVTQKPTPNNYFCFQNQSSSVIKYEVENDESESMFSTTPTNKLNFQFKSHSPTKEETRKNLTNASPISSMSYNKANYSPNNEDTSFYRTTSYNSNNSSQTGSFSFKPQSSPIEDASNFRSLQLNSTINPSHINMFSFQPTSPLQNMESSLETPKERNKQENLSMPSTRHKTNEARRSSPSSRSLSFSFNNKTNPTTSESIISQTQMRQENKEKNVNQNTTINNKADNQTLITNENQETKPCIDNINAPAQHIVSTSEQVSLKQSNTNTYSNSQTNIQVSSPIVKQASSSPNVQNISLESNHQSQTPTKSNKISDLVKRFSQVADGNENIRGAKPLGRTCTTGNLNDKVINKIAIPSTFK